MTRRILFPFHLDDDNREAYFKAMQSAVILDAHILCFTSTDHDNDEKELDQVYFHLLGLWGQWRHSHQGWKSKSRIRTENRLMQGDYYVNLQQVVDEWSPHWVVCHPNSLTLNRERLAMLLPQKLEQSCSLF